MTAVLEINDFELTLAHNSVQPLYQAPAMAIVRDQDIVFGDAAQRQFRLFPRNSNLQYLAKLNADPISQPVRAAANHADLVYLHLKELQQLCSEELLLAVPGNLSADQLGVLLGIAQEVGFTVAGFVDCAVAALAQSPAPAVVHYIDIHLQHVVITELAIADEVRRVRTEDVRDCGVANLVDGWVNLVADRFVAATRFDPLHTADTEQQLYNQAFDWLSGTPPTSELNVVITHADSERRVELPRSELEAKARQRYRRVLDQLPADANIAISARLARVPGFAAALRADGHEVTALGLTAVSDGCRANLQRIVDNGNGLRLVTALPHEHGPQVSASSSPSPLATHLLNGNIARALDCQEAVRITASNGEQWLQANAEITVNGEPVIEPRRLRVGDLIKTGNDTLIAIRVE